MKRLKQLIDYETKKRIVELISNGKPTHKVCSELQIHPYTLFRETARDPKFDKAIHKAMIYSTHLEVEGLKSIYDGCDTMVDVQRARGQSDNIKWIASKRVPDVYGENLNINLKATVDLTKVLEAANNRVIPYLQEKQVESLENDALIASPLNEKKSNGTDT